MSNGINLKFRGTPERGFALLDIIVFTWIFVVIVMAVISATKGEPSSIAEPKSEYPRGIITGSSSPYNSTNNAANSHLRNISNQEIF